MYELVQNLLSAAWYGQPGDGPSDKPAEAVADAAAEVSERLHRDLDACFQAIHDQLSEPRS